MAEGRSRPMFVVLPQQLAASHLRQCQRHLMKGAEDHFELLYAAQAAHMALHTMLILVRYGETGIKVARPERKNRPPEMLKEGAQTRGFRDLMKEIGLHDDEGAAIELLTDIRDHLQHPGPGPMGYEVESLISGIEAAVRVGTKMWEHSYLQANSDDLAREEASVASAAVLQFCLEARSHWSS